MIPGVICYRINIKLESTETGIKHKSIRIIFGNHIFILTLYAPTPQNGQTHRQLPTKCLSVFDHFVGLTLKRLTALLVCHIILGIYSSLSHLFHD